MDSNAPGEALRAERKGGVFVRMFGSAILTQAMLSAASLLVGLILIRETTVVQYGYYILIINGVALLTGLQNGFIPTRPWSRAWRASETPAAAAD